jgi:hypothetical protein
MKKIYLTLAIMTMAYAKAYSVGLEASYNVTIVSFANMQFSARNIVHGFGLYTSIRGIDNGVNISSSKEVHNTLLSIQKSQNDFEIAYSDGEIIRSGTAFGVNKQWKFLFVGAAVGYCDVIEYQKITINSNRNISQSFSGQDGINRKFEWEVVFGSTAEFESFYIPVYFGWSHNYHTFFGIGVGRKF